jgi:hypothetical protein
MPESAPERPEPLTFNAEGPAIVYISSPPRTAHQIDRDGWDPGPMSARERGLCKALLEHTLAKFAALDRAEEMGLTVGTQKKATDD